MKPIEAGCKCVIVNSLAGNNGIIVKVIKCLGAPSLFMVNGRMYQPICKSDRWEVDTALRSIDSNTGKFIRFHTDASESILQRIDDDTTTWEHVKETCGFDIEKLK